MIAFVTVTHSLEWSTLDPVAIYHVLQIIAVIPIYARINGISPVIYVSVYLPHETSKQVNLEESLFVRLPDVVFFATFRRRIDLWLWRGIGIPRWYHLSLPLWSGELYRLYGPIEETRHGNHTSSYHCVDILCSSQVSSLNEFSPSHSSGSNGLSNGRYNNKARIRSSNLTGEQDVDTCFGCGLTGQLIVCQMSTCSRKFHPKCIKVKGQSFRNRSPTRRLSNEPLSSRLSSIVVLSRTMDLSISPLWYLWRGCEYRLCGLSQFILCRTSDGSNAWCSLSSPCARLTKGSIDRRRSFSSCAVSIDDHWWMSDSCIFLFPLFLSHLSVSYESFSRINPSRIKLVKRKSQPLAKRMISSGIYCVYRTSP